MSKDVRQMSDDELVKQSGSYGETKTQVEAMLRLKNSIEKLDKNTSKHNIALIALTIILLVVAITQIIVSISLSDIVWWRLLIIELSAFGIIIYFANRIVKETVDRKK